MWIKTTEKPPTLQDANWIGKVLAVCTDWSKPVVGEWRWETVAQFPEKYPYWGKHPEPPTMEEV